MWHYQLQGTCQYALAEARAVGLTRQALIKTRALDSADEKSLLQYPCDVVLSL